jgi:D-tyrosyl-tRNA(Tyr) deacylase
LKSIVLVFCRDPDKDPVSAHVLRRMLALKEFEETTLVVDGQAVLRHCADDVLYHALRLDTMLSHAYPRYAAFLNENFGSADAIIVINWHEAPKAPKAIFTVQTTGDMASGKFSPVDPTIARGLFLAVEEQRQRIGLDHFSTWMEATHWSGAIYGDGARNTVSAVHAPVIDLKIGSSPDDWSHPQAADVLTRAVFHLFDELRQSMLSLLCIGGTHFEAGFTQLIRDYGRTQHIALSHILPNHWLIEHRYDEPERFADLLACAQSIRGGVQAVVFHDTLKSSFKEQLRRLASTLDVPVLSHKKLRTDDIAAVIRNAVRSH